MWHQNNINPVLVRLLENKINVSVNMPLSKKFSY